MATLRGLDRGEPAVLVLAEVQRRTLETAFSTGAIAAQAEQRGIAARIDALARLCRSVGVPVIHVHKTTRPDHGGNFNNCLLHVASNRRPLPENLELALSSPVEVAATDYLIQRVHGISCFHNTELESIMLYYEAKTLILVGVSTDMNLPATSVEAVSRGLHVVLPEDCTAGSSPEVQAFQLANMLKLLTTITDSATVTKVLEARRGA